MSEGNGDREAPEAFLESTQLTKEERQEKMRERARQRQQEKRETMHKAEELGARSRAANGESDPLAEAAHRDLSETVTVFDERGPGVDLDILPVDPDRGIELGRKATAMQNALSKLDEKSEEDLTDEDMERVRDLKDEVASVFEEVTMDEQYDAGYVYETRSGLHIAIEVMNAIQERAAERQREEAEEAQEFRQ